jgi:leader peptidase (prepilin peptidase)/N-methyltransferase
MSEGQLSSAVTLYVFAVAACVGSFLNVVIARLPHGRSIVHPPSACPRCAAAIRWYDNIPIVSWLILRARCRNCGLPISPRYPLVELLTALLVVAVYRRFGLEWATLGYAVLVCALIALTFIDLDTWLLPHEITWPVIALGVASPSWNPALRFVDSVIGAAAGAGLFAAIALFGEKVLHRETMGWGDVYLLGAIGAWLGWQSLLPVVLLSAVQGSVAGALLLWLKRPHPTGNPPSKEAPSSGQPLAGVAEPPATAVAAATGPANQSSDFAPRPTVDPGADPHAADDPAPSSAPHPPSDDDWVPPPHAVPFGPFLALAALEHLLIGPWIENAWFNLLGRLWG